MRKFAHANSGKSQTTFMFILLDFVNQILDQKEREIFAR